MVAPGIAPQATAGSCLSRLAAAVWRLVRALTRCVTDLVWNPAFRHGPPPGALIDCAWCGSDFVCPIAWEPADEKHWSMRLRCGACEVWRDVVVSNDDARRFDCALAAQSAVIARAAARLDRERMAIELDTFVAALECDAIDPSWFAR
jgi:hypothetical protein